MRDFLKLNSACVDATELTADSIGELAIHWPKDICGYVKIVTILAQIMQRFTGKVGKRCSSFNKSNASEQTEQMLPLTRATNAQTSSVLVA